MEPVFSDWLTGTLLDEGWGPRDDKIVQFASHYFLYFPIFHLKYSYIFPIFCPSEFLYSYFFVKKVTGRPARDFTPDVPPPNRPDLNPVDYWIWTVIQQCIYQKQQVSSYITDKLWLLTE